MKKLLLATAVAALSVSAANAAPTVYGKAFLTVDAVDADDNSSLAGNERAQLNSQSSRIGLKGSEALTANTDVVYKLEYGVDVDANSNGKDQFYSRDTYLGLQNAQYGTVIAGRLTTIDDYVDYADVLEGENVAKDAGYAFDEPRANNSVAYFTPENNGMQFMAMYVMDEDNGTDSFGRDAFGLGAKYEMGQMNVGASYIQSGDQKAARISGSYDVSSQLTLGGLYQMTDLDTDDNENAVTLSAEMATVTPWTYYAQVNMIDNAGGNADAEALGVGVGGKYAFSKAATGHLYAGYLNEDSGSSDGDAFGLGGGLEYKF